MIFSHLESEDGGHRMPGRGCRNAHGGMGTVLKVEAHFWGPAVCGHTECLLLNGFHSIWLLSFNVYLVHDLGAYSLWAYLPPHTGVIKHRHIMNFYRYFCACVRAFTPGAFLCANRSDVSSRTFKALLTDIVSHTPGAGAAIPHQDGVLNCRRTATADLLAT